MFRVKDAKANRGFSWHGWAVQGSLLLALLAACASAYLLHLEHDRLGAWLAARPTPDPESLRAEVGILYASSLVVAVILACCSAAVWWLRRRYLSSQGSLRQVKMLAQDILASMDRGVVTTNRAGGVTSINSAGLRLLGVNVECVGGPLAAVAPPDVPLVGVCREVVEGGPAVRDRDFTVGRAGRAVRLRVDAHALKDTGGTVVGCVLHLRDVTERMLLEERMRRMERFLNLAALASGLHHEIKNPLTALSIHIQLLEEALARGEAGESADEFVGVIKNEVCRLNGVLESFRTFANLQRLALQPTDALAVVENAVRLVRPQAAGQGVRINLVRPDGEPAPVPLDADKFEQAVLNLVINALEAMPEGGELTITSGVRDGGLRVSVRDSGPGIPPEVQRHLFQPYFSTKGKGSGMGLALSEKLIGQHGGHIEYRTGSGGTTFEITIPLQQKNGAL
jgi:signal transduction histidine kinase